MNLKQIKDESKAPSVFDIKDKLENMFLYNLKNKGYAVLYNDEDVSVVCDKEHVNKAFSILSRECPDPKVQMVSDIPGYDSSKRYHELECSKSNGWYAQSSSSIIMPDFWEWADTYQYLIYSGQMTANEIKLSNPA